MKISINKFNKMRSTNSFKLKAQLITGIIILCLLFSPFMLSAAKYAGEPFYLGVGAQALGMGSAFSAVCSDVTSGFWNPAGLTELDNKQAAFMHSETFGSLLNHDYVAFALPLDSSGGKAAALSLTRLGGGGIKITEWDQTTNRPRIISEENHADYQLILSYAFKYSSRLAVGVNTKFIYRDIPTSSAYGIGADLGLKYFLSDSFTASLTAKDITTTLLAYGNGTKESIYPTVISGFMFTKAMRNFDFIFSAQGDFRFEGLKESAEFWQGSISLDTHWGVQAAYHDKIFIRSGLDIGRLTLGGGIKYFPFQIDFAYLKHKELDDSFRISALFFWK